MADFQRFYIKMHPALAKASVHKANWLLEKISLTMNNRKWVEDEKLQLVQL